MIRANPPSGHLSTKSLSHHNRTSWPKYQSKPTTYLNDQNTKLNPQQNCKKWKQKQDTDSHKNLNLRTAADLCI